MMKIPMIAFYLLTTFLLLEKIYRKFIDNSDLIWFINGSHLKDEQGHYQVPGYAGTFKMDVIKSYYLPEMRFSQQSNLIALTQACQLAKDEIANIYTGSHYAFGVDFDFEMLWKQQHFLTSSGQSIKNGKMVVELLVLHRSQDNGQLPQLQDILKLLP